MAQSFSLFAARMSPSLHARLSEWAKAEGLSLNALLVKVLEASVTEREKTVRERKPNGP